MPAAPRPGAHQAGRGDAAGQVFDLIRAQLRSFDHASRLDDGSIAVVLSATPLVAAERLLGAMLRRIRQVCEPALTCSAGLIGYGGLAQLTVEALMESAETALAQARCSAATGLRSLPARMPAPPRARPWQCERKEVLQWC